MTGSALIAMGIVGLPVLAVAGVAWLRRRLTLITVVGNSMKPAFAHGDRLLIARRASYAAGDVIMFRAPEMASHGIAWLVKRAAAMLGDPVPQDLIDRVGAGVVPAGQLVVLSDTPDGADSRQFGLIRTSDVIGVVRNRRRPPSPRS